MRISNSMVRSYQQCHRAYDYKFGQQLIPKHAPLPLKRGSWLHELLEAKYSTGDWRRRQAELTAEFMQMFEEEREIYGNLPEACEHIMESYDYRWRGEDAQFTFHAIEQEFEVELPDGHVMVFRIDGIVEDEWGIWLMEHKSHKTIPDNDYRFMDMQSAKYLWGLRRVGFPDVIGVLWNYMCTVEPKKPKLTQGGRLSRRKIRTDLFTYVSAIKEYRLDPHDYRDDIMRLKRYNDFFRRERVPVTDQVIETLILETVDVASEIERGFQPTRSISRGCDWCPYQELCMTELYGGDGSSIISSKFQRATSADYYAYANTNES